jgi:preprotein translocase subunit SecE
LVRRPGFRVLGVVLFIVVAVALSVTTEKGAYYLNLLKDANIERRKVIWPTKQETGQTTLIVAVVVLFAALVLWAVDSLFSWLISFIIS